MGKPRLLLLDEPSLGLSPLLVDQILAAIVSLKANGITVLLVEQNASAALEIADRAYVMETGRIVSTGEGSVLLSDPKVKAAYLGADQVLLLRIEFYSFSSSKWLSGQPFRKNDLNTTSATTFMKKSLPMLSPR